MKRIIEGIAKFQSEIYPQKKELFAELASGQRPDALMISCADSRVDMQLVTQSEPGQLFFFRNAGNIVPPYGAVLGAVSATIEYAVLALRVRHIVVCGHSDCGAMRGILEPDLVKNMPTVAQWLRYADVARQMLLENHGALDEEAALEVLAHENVVAQINNLKTHPSVAVALARGEIEAHGWYYDIPHGEVSEYDDATRAFRLIGGDPSPSPLDAGGMTNRCHDPAEKEA
jgi:carbonic anhydrase